MRLRLHNIGPIRDADVDLAPLTVVIGPNGSGKTTLTSVVYSACLAHAQAMLRAFEVLDNPFFRRGSRPRGSALTRTIVTAWERTFIEQFEFELRRCCAPDLAALARARRGGRMAAPRIELSTERWCMTVRLNGDGLFLEDTHARYQRPLIEIPRDGDLRSSKRAVELALRADVPPRAVYFPAGRSGFVQTHTALSGLVLGALSGGYFQDATLGAIPGATADFMRLVAQLSTARTAKSTVPIAQRFESSLLRGRVRLDDEGAARQVLFRPEGHDAEWPVQNMATSVAEFSPLVLYLRHVARAGDALLIDEPESHLHPQSQVQLADRLVELSRILSPVIIATHSEFLVSALSNNVLRERRGGDEPDKLLAVYQFGFHDEDRGLGVDVAELDIDPDEGFEIDQFSAVADEVFGESVRLYNELHSS